MTEQQDRRATVRVGGRSDGSVEAAAAKRRPGMLTFAAAAVVVFVAAIYGPQRNSVSRGNAMATLSVLKFNDPGGADRVMIALQGMQERELITLQDAAVVRWPLGKRKPETRQLHSTAGAGALGGAFWGF